jgi:transposase-like protein
MLKEEINLINKLEVNTLNKFNFNARYNSWISEHYKLFKKPAPDYIKKLIKKTKLLWIKDEFVLFRILCNSYLNRKYTCPKCESKKGFIPTRYKKIGKMLKINKFVRIEKPRTLSCTDCSYTFNPLSYSVYRRLKLDLRVLVFYTFFSDDGKIDYPIQSISKILNISYNSAKNIKKWVLEGREFSDQEIDKHIKSKDDDYPVFKILLQNFEYVNNI